MMWQVASLSASLASERAQRVASDQTNTLHMKMNQELQQYAHKASLVYIVCLD